MKKIFSTLFILVLVVSLGLVTAAPVAADPGTTYYVSSTTGSDGTGDGSSETPWATIQHAVGQVSSGDTIMVAAGEYEAFEVQEKTNINIKSTEGATVTNATSFTIDVGLVEDTWVMAVVNASQNINIEGIDFDGTTLGDAKNGTGIVYFDSTGSIANLTVKNISSLGLGTPGGMGVGVAVAIVSGAGTSAVNLSGVTVHHSMAGVGILNATANIKGCCTINETFAGIAIGSPDGGGFGPSTVTVQGSNISNNLIGIWVCDNSTVEAHFNNIASPAEYGVQNDGDVTVNATRNWWGDASGPYHETLNPDGLGLWVSDKVDFNPWLGAEAVTEKVFNGTGTDVDVDAKDEADTEVLVTGNATITVARYAENPGGNAPTSFNATGKYIDVYVPNTTEVTQIEIRVYYTDAEVTNAGVLESSLRLLWWNGSAWVQCSPDSASGVNTASINGYSGYMWAKITATTTPSLADLQGTEFGGYGHTSETPPRPPCGGCFIATAAYGTDTAKGIDTLREFRDEVLLPKSLGAKFVSFYYRTSPPIANFISQHEVLRTVVRVGLVDPIVKILNWTHDLWSARGS
jgi:hypothetical protein